MASASVRQPSFYCHTCDERIEPITEDVICPNCRGGFVEKLEEEEENAGHGSSQDGFGRPVRQNDMMQTFNLIDLISENGASNPMGNVFSFGLSNNRARSTREDGSSAASSSAPYNLRQRPDRPGSSRVEAEHPLPNQHFIQDAFQQLFGSFDPSVFQISFGGMDGMPPLNMRNLHGSTADYAWGPNGLDNIISQLLGQLENAGPPPASKTTIAKLPKISITQEDVIVERDCSVCMNAFNLDESAKKLPCGHFFHIPCIDPWLELHNTCPICRKVVEEDSSCRSQTSSSSSHNNSSSNNSSEAREDSSSRANASSDQSNAYPLLSFLPDFFRRSRNNDDDHSNTS